MLGKHNTVFLNNLFRFRRKWTCLWGNQSLSQKFLLEGRRRRVEKEGKKRRKRGGRGRERVTRERWKGQTESERQTDRQFPREPRSTPPCPSFRIPWKLFKSAEAGTACPPSLPPTYTFVIDLIWGTALALICFQIQEVILMCNQGWTLLS